jgi:molecular chaperone DnaJ
MATDIPDFYELLGVSRRASDDDLKKAYRRLARELHPDANPGDAAAENRFKQVTLAYETLRDPAKRQRYDAYGIQGVAGAGAGAGPGGAQDPFAGFGMGGIGDLFDAFFGAQGGGGRSSAAVRQGPDLETVADLSFRDAIFGTSTEVTIKSPVVCDKCEGSGAKPDSKTSACSTCNGVGEVRRVRQSILGQMVTTSVCPTCQGYGKIVSDPCSVCRGEGRKTEERKYVVEVPAGVDDGATLRLTGRGGAGYRGAPAGDLYVHLRIADDPVFARDANHLYRELHVAFVQAALGATITYETIDGTAELQLEPGTQSGYEVRLRGGGVPSLKGRGRGDLFVRLVVDVPRDLTKVQDELLRQFAGERGEAVSPPDTSVVSKLKGAFGK